MLTIASIVEGHGEVEALPILLRRIAKVVLPDSRISVPRPIRVKRQRVVKPGELEWYVQLAAVRAGAYGQRVGLLPPACLPGVGRGRMGRQRRHGGGKALAPAGGLGRRPAGGSAGRKRGDG